MSTTKLPAIATDLVDKARAASPWDLGNEVLYDMCRRFPAHTRHDEIIAKIWLIGRSYAASIERRRNAVQLGDDFYISTVAPALKESGIDKWLSLVRDCAVPGLSDSVVVHKQLLDEFYKITELEKRSLASKYLHFHAPTVFYIYDSRARAGISRLAPRLANLPELRAPQYDKEYRDFVRRCNWLRDAINIDHKVVLTPRELDKLLLIVAEENK